jgi:chromosome segregation protein
MRLSRLELVGFKSFAGSVDLPFDLGVTAIVGPNGCGKSNISDAVRWVLGEQSPRLLRGGKMEDVIFQGSTGRRPVNVAEVSLVFDNSDGTLPIAYQEVVITRRLSRSGQSDYLLNRSPVRLRDIQDLLRGTGLGADAAVVMEAKMIDALLSEKAEERRALFEEAAGIGLYRNRKQSYERRLEETATDLARLEDLISEVQTQVRSLARQRGKAERYGKMIEERYGVAITLVRRELEDLDLALGALGVRTRELSESTPEARTRFEAAEHQREARVQERHRTEARRTEMERQLADAKLEAERLQSDLALAAERLTNAAQRRDRALEERADRDQRAGQAAREREAAESEWADADRELAAVATELANRTTLEAAVRETVRGLETELQALTEAVRSLEIERGALERERAELQQASHQAAADRASRQAAAGTAEQSLAAAAGAAVTAAQTAVRAVEAVQLARRRVAGLEEQEMSARAARRQAENAWSQLAARHDALTELEHAHVDLAPAAQALLAERDRFGGAVLGPLSDFVRTSRRDAELAERLLGEWLQAVLVRDAATAEEIREWHAKRRPGPLVLLPCIPGPQLAADGHPLRDDLRIDGPAVAWVRALLMGHEVHQDGRTLRRANGAMFLEGGTSGGGPLQRRAELESLAAELAEALAARDRTQATLDTTIRDLAAAQTELAAAAEAADRQRREELESGARKGDAERALAHARRDLAEASTQAERLTRRLADVESRLGVLDGEIQERTRARMQGDERLATERATLVAAETELEQAREQRVHWQVEAAQMQARLTAARERVDRAGTEADQARRDSAALAEEVAQIDATSAELVGRRGQWQDALQERRVALAELEHATREAATAVTAVEHAVTTSEAAVEAARAALTTLVDEEHRLAVERTELEGRKRAAAERVEAEWRKPLARLLTEAPEVAGDLEWLREENERLRSAIDAVGPVNALAVEEHAEETKRLEFLMTQRDDLVTARASLQQAAREIDQTAKALFLESFGKVRENFRTVFQTLFGGGECDVRLANEDEPLESEIEIHAAPPALLRGANPRRCFAAVRHLPRLPESVLPAGRGRCPAR